jgi:hypothetical protein
MFSYQLLKCKSFKFINKSDVSGNENYDIIIDDEHLINDIDFSKFEHEQNENNENESDEHEQNEQSEVKTINIYIDTTSKNFEDIKIIKSSDNENERSDKISKDIQKSLMGSSDNLEAIKSNQYSIVHGKKNANIQQISISQNHEVIDSLAVNGVMMGPKTELNSIKTLFNKISKLTSFTLTLYNPYLMVETIEAINPNLYSVPVVIVGKGDILKIFYRYICLYFFGYMTIKDLSNPDSKYEI